MEKQEADLFTAPPAQADGLAARRVAIDLLVQVLDRKQSLDHTLENHKPYITLDAQDRAFVRMLVTTTIRRLGQIDALLHKAQERPDAPKAALVTHILRLGVTQILFMVVPDHASVDTSVALTEIMGHERQKSFVNAVLRKLAREGSIWLKHQDAARLNTPEWLLKSWIADYGLRTGAEIALANLSEAPLDFTLKHQEDSDDLAKSLDASLLSTGSLRRMSGGNVRDLAGYQEGRWWIQDASSAIPSRLFGTLDGETVVDMCAAPGGKTLQLAAMGAHVIALDRSAVRLKRLDENLIRTGLAVRVSIEVADAAVWQSQKPITKILLDAPCSATGTIRRHPDLPYLKTHKDLDNLMDIQERLLNHAASILSPEGVLIYCTCSLQKDEGERQIEKFLLQHQNFSRIPITPEEIGGFADFINEHGDLRILPTHLAARGGMDGFFVSRLKKQ